MKSYAFGFLANAHRVSNDLHAADAAFAQAWQLWPSDDSEVPRQIEKSRLLDLEASLRREQGRFTEALRLLAEAFEIGPPESKGRALLKRASTLEQMGEHAAALESLKRAEPLLARHGDLRDRFALRFNTAVCLCHLDRAGEAEMLLAEIQLLASELGHALDLLRTRWLEGRVAAGLGRTAEALAILDEVCDAFLRHDPPLPCDAALAGLDLALYWLREGATDAVRGIALCLEPIFRIQGIRRESFSALRLFCEAARREAATLELARKAKAEASGARRNGRR